MRYINNCKLKLESLEGRTLFEKYADFDELASDFVRREEWLCTEFEDAFNHHVDDTGMIKYTTKYKCNHRPVLRFIGVIDYKDKEGKTQSVDYQIAARQMNFEYEEK